MVDETIESIQKRLAQMFDYDPTDDHLFGETLYELSWTIYDETDIEATQTMDQLLKGHCPLVEIVN